MQKTEQHTKAELREAYIAGVHAVSATRTGVLALSMLVYKYRAKPLEFDRLGNILKANPDDLPKRTIIGEIGPIWTKRYAERPQCVKISRDDTLLTVVDRIDSAKCPSCVLFQHGVCEAGISIPSPIQVNQPETKPKRGRRPGAKRLAEAI